MDAYTNIGLPAGIVGGRMLAAGQASDLTPNFVFTQALQLGSPQRNDFFGPAVMPNFPRSSYKVGIVRKSNQHLRVFDTERAYSEDRKRDTFVDTFEEHKMAWFGFEYGYDVRMLEDVDIAFEIRLTAARLSQRAINLDLENRIALLVGDSANYPVAHVFDESGAPWGGGASTAKATIKAAITQIRTAHPAYQDQHFQVVLTEEAWRAAKNDDAWNALRAGTERAADEPSLREFITHVFGADFPDDQILVRDALALDANDNEVSIWGETAIVRLRLDAPDINVELGQGVFALLHEAPPLVFPEYFEDRKTTRWLPVEARKLPVVHDFTTGAIITNMVP